MKMLFAVQTLQSRISVLEQLVLDLKKELEAKDKLIVVKSSL